MLWIFFCIKVRSNFSNVIEIFRFSFRVLKEVPMKILCISRAAENIILQVPQKMPIYTFLVALSFNGMSIIIFERAPVLECIFRGN